MYQPLLLPAIFGRNKSICTDKLNTYQHLIGCFNFDFCPNSNEMLSFGIMYIYLANLSIHLTSLF